MRRVTIPQLAAEAGVSISTVNRVLSGKVDVRPETVQHVLAVAEAIGFYGAGTIRSRLKGDRPKRRLGLILQQEGMPFHHELGERFRACADAREDVYILARVEHVEDLDPLTVASRLRELGKECDAVAITYADHPAVNRVIDELTSDGKPVFTAVSDLSANSRAGYVGLDNRRFGRAAAWYASRLENRGKEVAILMGTHRHVCQEQREMGFRSYLREHAPELKVLEAITTHESDLGAYDATSDLLRRHPDLTALYVTGGGVRGAIRALREHEGGKLPHVISCELNDDTRQALLENLVTVVLAHPMEEMVTKLIDAMVDAVDREDRTRAEIIVPFVTATSESL